MIEQAILILHVLAAIAIVALVLLQQGKGADAGASFGGGSSQTVFGVQGSGNALTQWTSILAAGFFVTSLALAYFAKQQSLVGTDMIIDVPAIETVTDEGDTDVPILTVPAESASDVPDAAAADSDVPVTQ
jgi:preprotein translocase subunit SecG